MPPEQTVSVTTPISIRGDAPAGLTEAVLRQHAQIEDTRQELERELYNAAEIAKSQGLVKAFLYIMRADRLRTVDGLRTMAAEADAAGNAQRATTIREIASLIEPSK